MGFILDSLPPSVFVTPFDSEKSDSHYLFICSIPENTESNSELLILNTVKPNKLIYWSSVFIYSFVLFCLQPEKSM